MCGDWILGTSSNHLKSCWVYTWCYALLWYDCIISCDTFFYILQGCFDGTGAIARWPQWQWSDVEMSRVSCQKGPICQAWWIGPFWQDTLDVWATTNHALCVQHMGCIIQSALRVETAFIEQNDPIFGKMFYKFHHGICVYLILMA